MLPIKSIETHKKKTMILHIHSVGISFFCFSIYIKNDMSFFCLTSCVIVFFIHIIYICTNVVIYIFVCNYTKENEFSFSYTLLIHILIFIYVSIFKYFWKIITANENAHKIFIYHLNIIKFNDRIKYVQKKIININ